MARHQLRRRPGRITLDTADLVHETYLKLVDGTKTTVRDHGHFLALFARVMRQVVVDHVRRRCATKRGGGEAGVHLIGSSNPLSLSSEDLLALDEALERLKTLDPRGAQLVELRFFGGLSIEAAAGVLGVSVATVKRDWERNRAHLYKELRCPPDLRG